VRERDRAHQRGVHGVCGLKKIRERERERERGRSSSAADNAKRIEHRLIREIRSATLRATRYLETRDLSLDGELSRYSRHAAQRSAGETAFYGDVSSRESM